MLHPMFGIGGSEILVILVVALLFLGPDKLPDAARTISKGIRDLKKQSRLLQNQIEGDEHIGGAIRDLKSALRGDEIPVRPVRREPPKLVEPTATSGGHDEPRDDGEHSGGEATAAGPDTSAAAPDATAGEAPPALTLPMSAGEPDPDGEPSPTADELAHLIKPAAGTVAKTNG